MDSHERFIFIVVIVFSAALALLEQGQALAQIVLGLL